MERTSKRKTRTPQVVTGIKKASAALALVAGFGASLFLLPGSLSGMGGWASAPATKNPFAYYAKNRSSLPKEHRVLVSKDELADDLVVTLDDFTYTGVIKASATNPYNPPAKRPPAKKK